MLGTIGEAPANIRLVQDAAGSRRLDLPADAKVAYLTQTTLSVDNAEVIIARAAEALSAHRRPDEGRHLLRHAESPGGGQGAGAGSGRRARARQPQ